MFIFSFLLSRSDERSVCIGCFQNINFYCFVYLKKSLSTYDKRTQSSDFFYDCETFLDQFIYLSIEAHDVSSLSVVTALFFKRCLSRKFHCFKRTSIKSNILSCHFFKTVMLSFVKALTNSFLSTNLFLLLIEASALWFCSILTALFDADLISITPKIKSDFNPVKSKVSAGIKTDESWLPSGFSQVFPMKGRTGRAHKNSFWIKYETIIVAGIDLIKANFSLVSATFSLKRSFVLESAPLYNLTEPWVSSEIKLVVGNCLMKNNSLGWPSRQKML